MGFTVCQLLHHLSVLLKPVGTPPPSSSMRYDRLTRYAGAVHYIDNRCNAYDFGIRLGDCYTFSNEIGMNRVVVCDPTKILAARKLDCAAVVTSSSQIALGLGIADARIAPGIFATDRFGFVG